MDTLGKCRQYWAMRILAALVLFGLAACSGNPGAYGITGPNAPVQPEAPTDATLTAPGLPDNGTMYGPTVAPTTGQSRYWGYN